MPEELPEWCSESAGALTAWPLPLLVPVPASVPAASAWELTGLALGDSWCCRPPDPSDAEWPLAGLAAAEEKLEPEPEACC